jgi:glucan phosphoethanolaminetransferase (alkaline phosphatase superfamily)
LKDWRFGATLPPDTNDRIGRQVYVLIIGESSRADRLEMNGYSRGTDPLLTRERNIVVLHDIVSPWSFTVASVPVILSRKQGTDRSRLFNEKSLLSLFREAGYRTYWVYNQAQPTGASAIAQLSSDADEKFWLNISANDVFGKSNYDENLLGPMQKILHRPEIYQFIILHLMGSHDAYQRRYPASFNAFVPSSTDVPQLNDKDPHNKTLVNNAYDNSVRCTDFVIDSAIRILAESSIVSGLFYTSDHGESVFDGTCQLIGHGGTARHHYPVAALVWLSDPYVTFFPDVMAALRKNAGSRMTTENTFESMADLARITYPTADRSRSIFSASFSERPRMVNAGERSFEWDKAGVSGACENLVPNG